MNPTPSPHAAPLPPHLPRSAGVLLHPSSLPGPFGIGDLGPAAYRWVDFLASARQTWWQILPLNPAGAGDSPYTAFSAFAGNVNLLSPELLAGDGLFDPHALHALHVGHGPVDYGAVNHHKRQMLRGAWDRYRAGHGSPALRAEFDQYREAERDWLDDYALFMAIRDGLGGRELSEWPADLLKRDPVALAAVEKAHADEVQMHRLGQYLFDRQWRNLRKYAAGRGVRFIGDAPIFVSGDSADVWANRSGFLFDAAGRPKAVAGVPPDYFSPTGQLWGNPLYDWDAMKQTGYRWWSARLRRLLEQVDLVRLDHFRGFAAAWHVPTGDATALNGRWVDGPRADLFSVLKRDLGGHLPLIAEDLGLITPDVHALRHVFGLPGMAVLQFMLASPDNFYWPHNYEPLTIVYTGTHDNNTTVGWFRELGDRDRWVLAEYLGHGVQSPAWDLIRMAWQSVAAVAVAPAQDLLELGSEARMNVPGVAGGNWRWRLPPGEMPAGLADRLHGLTNICNRVAR